jgi:sugar lactone lactonase YvrE
MPRALVCLVAALLLFEVNVRPQAPAASVNDRPNPYRTVENYFKLAEGRWWNSTSAVDIDIDGKSVWVAERCAENSCADSKLNPILEFDESGNLVKRFGEGMFILPHGIHVDRGGNVWIADADGPDGKDPNKNGKGHAVYQFSPAGQVLLTLGKPGVAGDGTGPLLNQPTDIVTAPNGDIFVADGDGAVARVVKFARSGTLIKFWGKPGSGPGEFKSPHSLAIDSRGRLFVADRGNNRIQIFDQDGRFLAAWKQFGRPSGIFVDRRDVLYCADSESSDTTNPGWKRGIRIGSARDGTVTSFIPAIDPDARSATPSGADGVAADAQGNVYGAEVNGGASALKKYVKAS